MPGSQCGSRSPYVRTYGMPNAACEPGLTNYHSFYVNHAYVHMPRNLVFQKMVKKDIEDIPTALVRCETTAGTVTLELIKSWSPIGVDRATELFKSNFFDDSHFFRVVPGFLVQFGISYTKDKELQSFSRKNIPDDPQLDPPIKFREGIVSYAGSGPNTRSSQMFISYGSSPSLGTQVWETPIGRVAEGMETVRKFNSDYGDMPPWGKGPEQHKVHNQGASYIEKEYPLLDKFLTCTVEEHEQSVADDIEREFEQIAKDVQAEIGEVGAKSNILDHLSAENAKPSTTSLRRNISGNRPESFYLVPAAIFFVIIFFVMVMIMQKKRVEKTSKSL